MKLGYNNYTRSKYMNLVVNNHNIFLIVFVTFVTSLLLVLITKKMQNTSVQWIFQMKERFTKFQCLGLVG